MGETLECQMIQVFRQIENKQSFLSIQFQKVRRENIDLFLKESIVDMKRRGEEEE